MCFLCYSRGYDIVMTTSLSSDVPVGYFSWAEYDIMAPVQPKIASAVAAAFISNCGAMNFRLQALIGLEKENVSIDSYGACRRNRDGKGDASPQFRPICEIKFCFLSANCQVMYENLYFLIFSVDKVEALKHYKFSLAFENSNEEDYVTEKFFQSLVAG